MKVVVGLGNPGSEYEWTPHNLGFLAVDVLAERAGIRVTRPEAKSLTGRGELAGHEVVLAKPQTMMNLSGVAVRMLLERYECGPADLIVMLDELDLPWGALRIREKGRSSTHNGFRSILGAIGTDEFARVRIGVQPRQPWGDMKDYLLSTMGRQERQLAQDVIVEAADAVESVITEGISKAMSRFNRRVTPDEENSL